MAATASAGESATSLVLADNGKATLPIIISRQASPETKQVASEMAGYLQRITGATFSVAPGDGSQGIVLGNISEFPHPELERPLEVKGAFDGKEAYAIRTEPNRLLLIGRTDLGTSHAAFRFLEMIGCRWFFPSSEWEVIPSTSHLAFNGDETGRPAILARTIGYGFGLIKSSLADAEKSESDYNAWCRHNRMACSFVNNCSHAWQGIISTNLKQFEQHPEYYALVNGKRQGPQMEVTNPAVQQMAIDYALDYFKANPASDMVSIEPSDGSGLSESEEAKKLGSISNQVFSLANTVARAVAQKYPGKMVGLYAYGWHSDPPSFKLEPNIHVERTAGFIYSKHSDEELWKLWPEKTRNLGVYTYFAVWQVDFDRLPGGEVNDVFGLQKKIQFYSQHHVTSLTAESSNDWGANGRGYYAASHLLWNPKSNLPALLNDFYEKAFGPAAPAMKRYYERLDPANKPLMSENLLALSYRDLQAASQAAQGHIEILKRIDEIKDYLHYNYLFWLLDKAKTKDEKKALTLTLITDTYRGRLSYMNHWEGMRQFFLPQAARDFAEPTWEPDSISQPWIKAVPKTSEEIEKDFTEGLAYFQPQTVTEKSFSTDLVPVEFNNTQLTASSQEYQTGPRYVLYGWPGRTIHLEVTTGIVPVYRASPDAQYVLSDSTGKTITCGRLPLDGKPHSLSLDVPRKGFYYFDLNDSFAAWEITASGSQPISVALERDRVLQPLCQMQDMYFYIPKGTKEVDYYSDGGPHSVYGASSQLLATVTQNKEFIRIPVPQGQDGATWHIKGLEATHFFFFNIPNYIAASPDALLVPRDVAQSDGLKIKQ